MSAVEEYVANGEFEAATDGRYQWGEATVRLDDPDAHMARREAEYLSGREIKEEIAGRSASNVWRGRDEFDAP